MLSDASAVTAACEKRRKFALRKIKNNADRDTRGRVDKFMRLGRKACIYALQI